MDFAFNNGWLFTEDYDAGFDKAILRPSAAHGKGDTL